MIIIELLKSLDNRDIALLSWLVVLILWISLSKRFRKQVKSLLKAFFVKPIIISVILLICYLFVTVKILTMTEIWDLTQLKATIFWFFTVGLKSLFDINKDSDDTIFFSKKIKVLFNITILLDFYVNLFKMPLWVEFIFLPLMSIVVAVQVFTKEKDEYQKVHSLVNNFMAFVGLCIFVYKSWLVVINFSNVYNLQTFKSFAIPIILSIFLLPFNFAVIIYVAYENVFTRLQFIIKDKSLHRFTKLELIKKFHFKRNLLHKWFMQAWSEDLSSKEDIKLSIIKKIMV